VTWFLTGLWHGANYTFIVWGMINGLFLIIYHWQRKPRKRLLKQIGLNNNNRILTAIEGLLTFIIVVLSWVIFRSESVQKSVEYLGGIFSDSLFISPQVLPLREIFIAMAFVTAECIQRHKPHALQIDNINNRALRWTIYIGVVCIIILFGGGSQKFIYFRF